VAECADDFRFLGYSGLVVLTASLSESDVVDGARSRQSHHSRHRPISLRGAADHHLVRAVRSRAANPARLRIVAFMVVAWITQAMDYALAGFIGCFLFWALGIVRFPVAFSGFANDTSWFLFGALLIGAIAMRSGVARRLAYIILLRVGITYPRILLGLIITDFLLTFVVPSGIARVVIMAAIALGLIEAFGAARAAATWRAACS
jgi:di/tricarboxylate transporter